MKSFIALVLFLGLCVYFTGGEPCFAQQEKQELPFVGKISADDVNIRAGYNLNFELLGKLNKDDTVSVLDKVSNWHRIDLPKNARCFVSKEYIEPDIESQTLTMATVKTGSLNVRAKASTTSSIIGQLYRDERVILVNELPEWYQIEPTEGCFGWVWADYVELDKDEND